MSDWKITKVGEDIGVGEWGDWYVLDLTGDQPHPVGGAPVRTKEVAIQKALSMIDRGDYRAKGETPESQMARFRSHVTWQPAAPAETALCGLRDEVRKRLDNATADASARVPKRDEYSRTRAARRRDTLAEVHALIIATMRDAGIPDYT